MQLTANEYLDVRALSPGPFRIAEAAGLVKSEELIVSIDDTEASLALGAQDILTLVSNFRQNLALLNALSLVVGGDRLKIRR